MSANMGKRRKEVRPVPLAAERCYCHRLYASDGRPLPYRHRLGAHPEFWGLHRVPKARP